MAARTRMPAAFMLLLSLVAVSILLTFYYVSIASFPRPQPNKISARDARSNDFGSATTADNSQGPVAAAVPGPPLPQTVASASESAAQRVQNHAAAASSSIPPLQPTSSDLLCTSSSSSSSTTSSLLPLTPSSPSAPLLLPFPSQVYVGNRGEGPNCDVIGVCCGPFSVGDGTQVHVVASQSHGAASAASVANVQSMVQESIVTISALAHREAVVLPQIKVCINQPDQGPNADVPEAYSLRVSGHGIIITCENKVGLAWALSTLRQLLSHWPSSGACVVLVVDQPRLAHRGVLLDVARNFVPMSDIMLLLHTMASVKLNVLHMHLTDDQAFAFASASCPEFTSSDPSKRSNQYSPADLQSIVSTASRMGIRIIPELDVPGHAAGFRFGNPGYIASCPAYIAKFKHWGIPLNPSHPQLMAVVARLINELSTIFPDRYLHLGGDEVSKPCWIEDPAFKSWVQAQEEKSTIVGNGVNINMKWGDDVTTDASALLMLQFMKNARENQKSVIVYQEVFDHQRFSADEHSVSQIWISKFALTEHVNRGVKAISAWGWYLNHGAEQCNSAHECYAIDHLRNIEGFQAMSDDGRQRIMGGEMALWEVPTPDLQDTMWPRAGGIAERLWSGHVDVGSADRQKDFLEKRLQLVLDDMKLLGWLKCTECANAAKKARK